MTSHSVDVDGTRVVFSIDDPVIEVMVSGMPGPPGSGGGDGLDEVHVGPTPPPVPFDGQVWVDTTGAGAPPGGLAGLDEATADARYVNVTGDTMTGPLLRNGTLAKSDTVEGLSKVDLVNGSGTATYEISAFSPDGTKYGTHYGAYSASWSYAGIGSTDQVFLEGARTDIYSGTPIKVSGSDYTTPQQITNLADPSHPLDAANKQYVDAGIQSPWGTVTLWADLPISGNWLGRKIRVTSGLGLCIALWNGTAWTVAPESDTGALPLPLHNGWTGDVKIRRTGYRVAGYAGSLIGTTATLWTFRSTLPLGWRSASGTIPATIGLYVDDPIGASVIRGNIWTYADAGEQDLGVPSTVPTANRGGSITFAYDTSDLWPTAAP